MTKTILAEFYGGPYDGTAMEIQDTYSFRVAVGHTVQTWNDPEPETKPSLNIGWYSRRANTRNWLRVPFVWKGWE